MDAYSFECYQCEVSNARLVTCCDIASVKVPSEPKKGRSQGQLATQTHIVVVDTTSEVRRYVAMCIDSYPRRTSVLIK